MISHSQKSLNASLSGFTSMMILILFITSTLPTAAQSIQKRELEGGVKATVEIRPDGNEIAVIVSAEGPGSCDRSIKLSVPGDMQKVIEDDRCDTEDFLGDVLLDGIVFIHNYRVTDGTAFFTVMISGRVTDEMLGNRRGAVLGTVSESFEFSQKPR